VKPRAASTRAADDALRLRALEVLGPLGDELAREALESGSVAIEHDVLAWEGSHGAVHAHRVVVMTGAELHARLAASHAARDGLSAALAAAMAERAGHSVADVRFEIGELATPASPGPYRRPRG
jgi:hypothetical protein